MGNVLHTISEDRQLDRLLTVDELCELLKLPKSTIYRWTSEPYLEGFDIDNMRFGFRLDIIESVLEYGKIISMAEKWQKLAILLMAKEKPSRCKRLSRLGL